MNFCLGTSGVQGACVFFTILAFVGLVYKGSMGTSSSTSISTISLASSIMLVTIVGIQVLDLRDFPTIYFFLFLAFLFRILVGFDYFSWASSFSTRVALALVTLTTFTILYSSMSSLSLSLLLEPMPTKVSLATMFNKVLTSCLE